MPPGGKFAVKTAGTSTFAIANNKPHRLCARRGAAGCESIGASVSVKVPDGGSYEPVQSTPSWFTSRPVSMNFLVLTTKIIFARSSSTYRSTRQRSTL